MPQTFLTAEQRRSYMLKKAVNNYVFESGCTKTALAKELGMSWNAYSSKMKNPDMFRLGELIKLLGIIGIPPEQWAEILK